MSTILDGLFRQLRPRVERHGRLHIFQAHPSGTVVIRPQLSHASITLKQEVLHLNVQGADWARSSHYPLADPDCLPRLYRELERYQLLPPELPDG